MFVGIIYFVTKLWFSQRFIFTGLFLSSSATGKQRLLESNTLTSTRFLLFFFSFTTCTLHKLLLSSFLGMQQVLMQAGHGVLQSGESRTVPSSTGSNSNLSKAWGLRLTSNVPASLESTHKPGVHASICKLMETRTYLRFTTLFSMKQECIWIMQRCFITACFIVHQAGSKSQNLQESL